MIKYYKSLKLLLPLLVTIIISIGGYVITDRSNDAQDKIALSKNAADLEISRVNASLRYLEILQDIDSQDISSLHEAQGIAVAVLPPELAFQILHDNIETNPTLFSIVRNKYLSDTTKLGFDVFLTGLLPWLQKPPRDIVFSFIDQSKEERKTKRLLAQVIESHLDVDLRQLITKTPDLRFRDWTYYRLFRAIVDHVQTTQVNSVQMREWTHINNLIADPDIDSSVKRDLLAAACMSLNEGADYHVKNSRREKMAEYFWSGYNLSLAEHPPANHMQSHLFRAKFFFDIEISNEVRIVSQKLASGLMELDFTKLSVSQIALILEEYISYNRGKLESDFEDMINKSYSYLHPEEVAPLIDRVLLSLNTAEKREMFAFEMDIMSGPIILNYVVKHDRQRGRKLSITMLEWYEEYWREEWDSSDLITYIITQFPDLTERAKPFIALNDLDSVTSESDDLQISDQTEQDVTDPEAF